MRHIKKVTVAKAGALDDLMADLEDALCNVLPSGTCESKDKCAGEDAVSTPFGCLWL